MLIKLEHSTHTEPTIFTVLKSSVDTLGLSLTDEQITQLLRYLECLQRWNKAYNLTAITDPEEMVTKHILDSLAVAPYLHTGSLLDVGTGAGLPGIPLAILDPTRSITLLDSNGKKIRFLTEVKRQLSLPNVQLLHQRLSTKPSSAEATRFDHIISRAFSDIATFVACTKPFAHARTQWHAMKAQIKNTELDTLDASFEHALHPLQIPGLEAERCVVCIQQREQTI